MNDVWRFVRIIDIVLLIIQSVVYLKIESLANDKDTNYRHVIITSRTWQIENIVTVIFDIRSIQFNNLKCKRFFIEKKNLIDEKYYNATILYICSTNFAD